MILFEVDKSNKFIVILKIVQEKMMCKLKKFITG